MNFTLKEKLKNNSLPRSPRKCFQRNGRQRTCVGIKNITKIRPIFSFIVHFSYIKIRIYFFQSNPSVLNSSFWKILFPEWKEKRIKCCKKKFSIPPREQRCKNGSGSIVILFLPSFFIFRFTIVRWIEIDNAARIRDSGKKGKIVRQFHSFSFDFRPILGRLPGPIKLNRVQLASKATWIALSRCWRIRREE